MDEPTIIPESMKPVLTANMDQVQASLKEQFPHLKVKTADLQQVYFKWDEAAEAIEKLLEDINADDTAFAVNARQLRDCGPISVMARQISAVASHCAMEVLMAGDLEGMTESVEQTYRYAIIVGYLMGKAGIEIPTTFTFEEQ